ncbi:hypothetical protein LXL04_023763 [Taraxacum kok-saghyz]
MKTWNLLHDSECNSKTTVWKPRQQHAKVSADMLNNCLKTTIAPTVKAIMSNKRQKRDPPLKKHHLKNNYTLSKAALVILTLIMEHLLKKGYKEMPPSFS